MIDKHSYVCHERCEISESGLFDGLAEILVVVEVYAAHDLEVDEHLDEALHVAWTQ
jgi:hypothetical protein